MNTMKYTIDKIPSPLDSLVEPEGRNKEVLPLEIGTGVVASPYYNGKTYCKNMVIVGYGRNSSSGGDELSLCYVIKGIPTDDDDEPDDGPEIQAWFHRYLQEEPHPKEEDVKAALNKIKELSNAV